MTAEEFDQNAFESKLRGLFNLTSASTIEFQISGGSIVVIVRFIVTEDVGTSLFSALSSLSEQTLNELGASSVQDVTFERVPTDGYPPPSSPTPSIDPLPFSISLWVGLCVVIFAALYICSR